MRATQRIARRYAKSLFDFVGAAQRESVRADLAEIRALASEPAVLHLLEGRRIPRTRRHELLRRTFAGRVSDATMRFLLLLERRRRMAVLPAACDAFMELCERASGVVRGRLATPFALEPGEVAALEERVARRIGGKLVLAAATDPDLIAGFKVRVEDCVYDHSAAGKLHRLRRRMAGTAAA